MDLLSFLTQSDNLAHIKISEEQFESLKHLSKLIFEENTLISDFVRIYRINDFFIFQERTPKDEILIRKFTNESEAKTLIYKRLNIYEKMWNGCGCKINYFE